MYFINVKERWGIEENNIEDTDKDFLIKKAIEFMLKHNVPYAWNKLREEPLSPGWDFEKNIKEHAFAAMEIKDAPKEEEVDFWREKRNARWESEDFGSTIKS